jgi:glycosyltransferase involved in cell wall biosynthesis
MNGDPAGGTGTLRVGFFVRVADPAQLRVLEFYRTDRQTLEDLGYEVVAITRVRDLPRVRADFYFAWWFGFGFFAALWARLRGRRCVLIGNVHTQDGRDLRGWPWPKRLVMKWALRLATATIYSSQTELLRLAGASASDPHVIHHAVDLRRYRPAAGPRRPVVVAITQLTRTNVARKMVLESLEAFALFRRARPSYRMVLVGEHGDALEVVQAKIAALGIADAVDLPGRVPFERKLELLQTATAYLQPSRCEGFGLAILEAQACGCPVVTNREPCIVEVNGDAVLHGEDKQALAAHLARLADDQTLWQRMRERGLTNARRYSYEARRERLRALLESLGLQPRLASAVQRVVP